MLNEAISQYNKFNEWQKIKSLFETNQWR
jgi:hypothetical protein